MQIYFAKNAPIYSLHWALSLNAVTTKESNKWPQPCLHSHRLLSVSPGFMACLREKEYFCGHIFPQPLSQILFHIKQRALWYHDPTLMSLERLFLLTPAAWWGTVAYGKHVSRYKIKILFPVLPAVLLHNLSSFLLFLFKTHCFTWRMRKFTCPRLPGVVLVNTIPDPNHSTSWHSLWQNTWRQSPVAAYGSKIEQSKIWQ